MKLLITALLILLPLTASAESRGGVTVGPSAVPHAAGTYGFGIYGHENHAPQSRFRGFHGRALMPFIGVPAASNLAIVNVQVERPDAPPPSPPKPPAPAKFWTARCGSFVELQVSPTLNLIEEEQKRCPE